MALEMMLSWVEGHPNLSSKQPVQWMIADTAIDAHAARLVSYDCLEEVGSYFELLSRGEKNPRYEREAISRHTAIAKAFCSKAASRAIERAMQVLGVAGYTEGSSAERCYRDPFIGKSTRERMTSRDS